MCGDSTISYPIEVFRTCRLCFKCNVVKIGRNDYLDWSLNGTYIQDAAPYLSVDDRELLISGICGSCFDVLYEGDDNG